MTQATAIVTGGTDGIGKAIARALAVEGCEVVVIGSDAVKGAAAAREIGDATQNPNIHFVQADLSSLRDTDALGCALAGRWPRLRYLVLCAGMVSGRRVLSSEGVEMNFAVDYLSRFVLTQRLLPNLRLAAGPGQTARILVIGGAISDGRINYPDVNLTKGFSILRVVSQFCAANDVFVIEQARRLQGAGVNDVTITSLKVGVVRTNIRRRFPLWMRIVVPLLFDPLLGLGPDEIAKSARTLLLAPEFEGNSGLLFSQIRKFGPTPPASRIHSREQGERLWRLSEDMAGAALAQPVSAASRI